MDTRNAVSLPSAFEQVVDVLRNMSVLEVRVMQLANRLVVPRDTDEAGMPEPGPACGGLVGDVEMNARSLARCIVSIHSELDRVERYLPAELLNCSKAEITETRSERMSSAALGGIEGAFSTGHVLRRRA